VLLDHPAETIHLATREHPLQRLSSDGGKPSGERLGGDVVVRGVPDDRASLEHDDLRRLVFHARARRDLLRHGALGANVHEKRRNVRMPTEEGFDLVQGRDAGGSGGAVFVQERTLRGEDRFQLAFVINNLPHDSLSEVVRDGGTGPISTCVFIIPCGEFQPAEPVRPAHPLTSLLQMLGPGR
jgi:hypothetical protein